MAEVFVDKFLDKLKTGKEFDNTLRKFGYIDKYIYKDLIYLEDDPGQGILQHISLKGNMAYKGNLLTIVFEVEHA